jgi:hypothetical protein
VTDPEGCGPDEAARGRTSVQNHDAAVRLSNEAALARIRRLSSSAQPATGSFDQSLQNTARIRRGASMNFRNRHDAMILQTQALATLS